MSVVISVNAGARRPNPRGKGPDTGIHKSPVAVAELRDPGPKGSGLGSGLTNDFVGDGRHHGGSQQAVYAFAQEELVWWGEQLGRELQPGVFGENLTTSGVDVDGALIGERWRISDAELVVTGPRVPCNVFRLAMAVPGWVKRFAEHGLTGAYLAIHRPGTVRAGDEVTISFRPEHSVTVVDLFRALTTEPDTAAHALTAAAYLDAELRTRLESRNPYGLDAEPTPPHGA